MLLVEPLEHRRLLSTVRLDHSAALGGDVTAYDVSPDGRFGVYIADAVVDEQFELYSIDFTSGQTRQLSDHVSVGDVLDFEISPQADRVVYRARSSANLTELYSVQLVGGGSTKLNGPLVEGGNVESVTSLANGDREPATTPAYAVSPDGSRVVYLADQAVDEVFELYSVPITGGPATTLNDRSLPEADVYPGFQISQDSSRVIYLSRVLDPKDPELFSVPVTGGTPTRLHELNDDLRDNPYSITSFKVSPDNRSVVFAATHDTSAATLFAVAIAGGAPMTLSTSPVVEFEISREGSQVVYLAGVYLDNGYLAPQQLASVSVSDGSSTVLSTRLPDRSFHSFQVSPGNYRRFQIGPQDTHVFFVQGGLYSVPLAGGKPARLSDPTLGSVGHLHVAANGEQVVYRIRDIYRVATTGGNSIRLTDVDAVGGFVPSFTVTDDGQRVVYLASQALGEYELFSTPLFGGPVSKLSGQLVRGGLVKEFRLVGDDRVVYHAIQDTEGVSELYDVALTGGDRRKLNVSLNTIGSSVSRDFVATSDGQYIVYRADAEVDEVFELYSVETATGVITKLNVPLDFYGDRLQFHGNVQPDFQVSPDGKRVIYRANPRHPEYFELFSVPITGGESVKLTGAGVPSGRLEFSPDSSRVVLKIPRWVSARTIDSLYSIPVDRSEPAVRLSSDDNVEEFGITPDGRQVVFTALARTIKTSVRRLYSVPITGGDTTHLNRRQDVHLPIAPDFRITPDSSQVLFRVRTVVPRSDGILVLMRVPITGGDVVQLSVQDGFPIVEDAAQQEADAGGRAILPTSLGRQGVDEFKITSDGSHVVYLADNERSRNYDVFSVPIAGGPVARLSASQFVYAFEISPDNQWVAYRSRGELFAVPLAGGPSTRLSDPDLRDWQADFKITPDSNQLAYRASGDLYITAMNGSEDPMLAATNVGDFEMSPGGESIFYRTDEQRRGTFDLYRLAIRDGSVMRINSAHGLSQGVTDFATIPGGDRIAYIADQDIGDRFGLYLRTELLGVSLIPDSTGLTLAFDGQLDTSPLNLYDAEAVTLGPADVVLEGAETGIVTGSLVLDPSQRNVRFIKSGGPLAADTYTVRLRGGSDGFKSPFGAPLLIGESGTSAEADFAASFAIPESNRVVSIPDFVRGPGESVNIPAGSDDGMPLTISDGGGLRSASVRIDYDPALLSITGATVGAAMPEGSVVTLDASLAGSAIVSFSSPTNVPVGASTLLHLQAVVPVELAAADYGRQQVLQIESVVLTDAEGNSLPATADHALHVTALYGDVTGNGRINAIDASRVARVAAQLDSGFSATPLTDPLVMADISGNGVINSFDAAQLIRLWLGATVEDASTADGTTPESIHSARTVWHADRNKASASIPRTHLRETVVGSDLTPREVDQTMRVLGNPESAIEDLLGTGLGFGQVSRDAMA